MLARSVQLAVGGGILLVGVESMRSPRSCRASEIKPDERVIFFPTSARLSHDGRTWIAPVHAWVFESKAGSLSREVMKRPLRKILGGAGNAEKSGLFDQRIAAFLVDNERGKQLKLQVVGDQPTYALPPTEPDGHTEGDLEIPADTARRLTHDGRLRVRAVLRAGDERKFEGEIQLIGPVGISVISDIDDTVKITEVRDRKRAAENTFLKAFCPVVGMPQLYRDWAQAGCALHFVSNSPWQLYEPLQEFLRASGFSHASLDLHRFRLKDPTTILDLVSDPGAAKRTPIERLVKQYPGRRFFLVGDSGERDPETYGSLAREFPDRIQRIYIRDVTGEGPQAARYRQAFQGLPADTWNVFRDPATLPRMPAMPPSVPSE